MAPPSHNDPTIPPSADSPRPFHGRAAGGNGAPAPAHTAEGVGGMIGPYRLLSILGEGGFGIVYLAERREPIVQRVALKVIKPGMDSAAVIARFEQERQALAVMDHPNVARVFDAGTTERGRPYFVMEYVQGEPITAYCDRNLLGTRERLALFIPVCEAVQHAHTKGIIHRDLKPSNVLIAIKDGQPIPKVIDFGIAKAITQTLTQKTIFTEQGQLVGTPEYMSPEQAEMGATDIDTRTDVYSLGVLLYELLTGTLPFDPRSLRSAGLAEIQRIIREVDPPRPSTRLSRLEDRDTATEVARRRGTGVEDLRRELHRELEWIPLKAMRKDRTQRYRTPAEMADDARNYLDGRPLIAGPESAGYRARKFLRRRKGLVAAVTAVALALVAGLVGTSVGLVRAEHAAAAERLAKENEIAARQGAERAAEAEREARTRAEAAAESERTAKEREARQRRRAEATTNFLHDMLASIDPEKARGRDVTVKEVIDDAAQKVGESFKDDPETEASLRETLGETYQQLSRYRESMEQLKRAHVLRIAALGGEHRETLVTQFNIAAIAIALREVDEAKRILTDNLASRRRTLGETHADTLTTRSLLGFVTQLSGDAEGALAIYRETLAAQRAAVGPGDKSTLETLASIADVLQDLGRLDEAEVAAAELVEAATAAQGPDGPTTLEARSIRASILKDLGRYAEAETIGRGVLDARTRIYGLEHAQTLTSMNVLGQTLEQLKKYDEQADLHRRAAETAARILGPEHDTTLTYLGNLARAEQLRGHLDEAARIMRRVLEIRQRTIGDEAQATLVIMNNLGLLLLDRHKPAEAEPIFRQMLAGIEKALPADHWMRGQARLNVAECLIDQQRYDEAEPLMLAGYQTLTETLPAGHSRTTNAATAIAKLYDKWGKVEKAEEWRAKAKP